MAELNTPIIIKASAASGEVPQPADLQVAELSVNTADGTLFTKHTDGSVVTISGGGGLDYVKLSVLQAEVAASTDFADFQARIAAL